MLFSLQVLFIAFVMANGQDAREYYNVFLQVLYRRFAGRIVRYRRFN